MGLFDERRQRGRRPAGGRAAAGGCAGRAAAVPGPGPIRTAARGVPDLVVVGLDLLLDLREPGLDPGDVGQHDVPQRLLGLVRGGLQLGLELPLQLVRVGAAQELRHERQPLLQQDPAVVQAVEDSHGRHGGLHLEPPLVQRLLLRGRLREDERAAEQGVVGVPGLVLPRPPFPWRRPCGDAGAKREGRATSRGDDLRALCVACGVRVRGQFGRGRVACLWASGGPLHLGNPRLPPGTGVGRHSPGGGRGGAHEALGWLRKGYSGPTGRGTEPKGPAGRQERGLCRCASVREVLVELLEPQRRRQRLGPPWRPWGRGSRGSGGVCPGSGGAIPCVHPPKHVLQGRQAGDLLRAHRLLPRRRQQPSDRVVLGCQGLGSAAIDLRQRLLQGLPAGLVLYALEPFGVHTQFHQVCLAGVPLAVMQDHGRCILIVDLIQPPSSRRATEGQADGRLWVVQLPGLEECIVRVGDAQGLRGVGLQLKGLEPLARPQLLLQQMCLLHVKGPIRGPDHRRRTDTPASEDVVQPGPQFLQRPRQGSGLDVLLQSLLQGRPGVVHVSRAQGPLPVSAPAGQAQALRCQSLGPQAGEPVPAGDPVPHQVALPHVRYPLPVDDCGGQQLLPTRFAAAEPVGAAERAAKCAGGGRASLRHGRLQRGLSEVWGRLLAPFSSAESARRSANVQIR
mmetsp:Transcript_87399/g.152167  ORF Transcript_87399/g.152167 Transcript_87399/m.152167 type:complete len:679 (-) Transcript_87399:157-2193(-)